MNIDRMIDNRNLKSKLSNYKDTRTSFFNMT